jgi:hypothetical protein
MQVPHEDKRTMRAVEAYMADERWDYYINLGDFMDFNCVSRYVRDLPRQKIGQTIAKDYEAGNAVLDRHCKAARRKNPRCEMVLLEGNHDYRIEAHIDKYPELEGCAEMENMLKLRERGIEWIRCHRDGATYSIGHATFIHGRFTNKYHSYKHCDYYGCNIFYGHTHDVQEYGKVLHGEDKTIKGKSLGCLCDYKQAYIKGNPTNWQQAFAVFWFFLDGYFQEHTSAIFKHRFIGPTNGKVYDGRRG